MRKEIIRTIIRWITEGRIFVDVHLLRIAETEGYIKITSLGLREYAKSLTVILGEPILERMVEGFTLAALLLPRKRPRFMIWQPSSISENLLMSTLISKVEHV